MSSNINKTIDLGVVLATDGYIAPIEDERKSLSCSTHPERSLVTYREWVYYTTPISPNRIQLHASDLMIPMVSRYKSFPIIHTYEHIHLFNGAVCTNINLQ